MLGIGPEVSIEPVDLIGVHALQGQLDCVLVRIQDGELPQDGFGFKNQFMSGEQRASVVTAKSPAYGDKFHHGLVRDSRFISINPIS